MPHSTTDDGCRLWTEASGDGPPVVLVHGGPGWWDVFGDVVALLPGFRVHRWDQRGCGRSDRHLRPPYVTDSLLRALPNAERVVLDGVGHYPWVEDPDGFQKAVQTFLS